MICCVVVGSKSTKTVKNLLETAKLLSKEYRITKRDEQLQETNNDGEYLNDGEKQSSREIYFALPLKCNTNCEEIVGIIKDVLSTCNYRIEYLHEERLLPVKTVPPFEQLYNFIDSHLKSLNIPNKEHAKLLLELPNKWETHGNLIMFPNCSFTSNLWKTLPKVFWISVAELFHVDRIAIKSVIDNDNFRTPNVFLCLGETSWVEHVDNGIKYTYDVCKNMFSKGNITEKIRISKFDCSDEIVVDLFAGIGYFVLPYLLKANAIKVYACEWNPDAVLALTRNLQLNHIEDKCEVLQGDNREVTPKNVADRVNLGLIPTSSASWKTACEALKIETGGRLHIHENVEVNNTNKQECSCLSSCVVSSTYTGRLSCSKRITWCTFTKEYLKTISHMLDSSKEWNVTLEHIEYVKSYAPYIDHLVFDILCRPVICE